jgi:hypothetical protein
MTGPLWVLVALGVMGAFDTLVFHEWIGKLPNDPRAVTELRLHAARDAVYATLFGSLAWFEPHGALVAAYAGLLAAEIAITLADFLVEDHTRRLPGGERVTHALMGIVFGTLLALLAPFAAAWSHDPTAFVRADHGLLSWALSLFAIGVAGSGVRDLLAASRLRSAATEEPRA